MNDLKRVTVTMLKAIKDISDSGEKATITSVRSKLNLESSAYFNSRLYELKKTLGHASFKKPKGTLCNICTLTKKGEKHLADNVSEVLTNKEMEVFFSGREKASAAPTKRMNVSKKASSAMDGIADLIDENRRMTATLQSIHRQIGDALGIVDEEVEDQPLS